MLVVKCNWPANELIGLEPIWSRTTGQDSHKQTAGGICVDNLVLRQLNLFFSLGITCCGSIIFFDGDSPVSQQLCNYFLRNSSILFV